MYHLYCLLEGQKQIKIEFVPTNSTKLNIAIIVGIISQFMQDLGLPHWRIIKRILRYLQGIKTYFLQYLGVGNGTIVIGVCDSNWGGDLDT